MLKPKPVRKHHMMQNEAKIQKTKRQIQMKQEEEGENLRDQWMIFFKAAKNRNDVLRTPKGNVAI